MRFNLSRIWDRPDLWRQQSRSWRFVWDELYMLRPDTLSKSSGNYFGMLIGLPIAILYFLARKITAEGAEERESA